MQPLATALKGKGLGALARRLQSIGQRYGPTAARMERSLDQLAQILGQFECRATLPVTAVALARNSAIIHKYQAQGIEFAVHGYLHVDYSQLPLPEQSAHFRKAGQVFRDHGIHFEGFRCPYLRWNEHTLPALSQANGFSYDSSTSLDWDVGQKHMTDSYERALSFYGAQPAADYLALPDLDTPGNLVRIPYCLPDDEALIERLKWSSPGEMSQVWPAMFHRIHAQGELFTLGLHPERTSDCINALVATLQEVRTLASTVWRARLTDVAAWWKARCDAIVGVTGLHDGVLQLDVAGPPGTTLLLRSLEVKTASEPWSAGYQRASATPCILRAECRPFIGVSPGVAPTLISFLRQQGYILETSPDPELYPFYLDLGSFSRQDGRRLIREIEEGDFPLARLGRWPDGAHSALTITGDIDALTLWDYGLRLLGN